MKSLGDGQLSVSLSPSSSIDDDVEVQQLCSDRARGHADPLQLRIGISAGALFLTCSTPFRQSVLDVLDAAPATTCAFLLSG